MSNDHNPLNVTIGHTLYPFLCKIVQADGAVVSQHPPKLWKFEPCRVVTLRGMSNLWKHMRDDESSCLLLGAPVPGLALGDMHRRTLKAKPDSPQTLRSVPTRWVILDMDGPEMPPGMTCREAMLSPEHVVEHVRGLLPDPFKSASCAWAWSGSMFHRKDRKARLRLAFMTRTAFHPGHVGAWFTERGAPVDPASFRPAQPIYTARARSLRPLPPHTETGVLYKPGGNDYSVPLDPAEVVRAMNATATNIVRQGNGANIHTASASILSGAAFTGSIESLKAAIMQGGDGLHDALLSYSFKLVMAGHSRGDTITALEEAMNRSSALHKTPERWKNRYNDIRRIVQGALDRASHNGRGSTGLAFQQHDIA
jgi:hypothetical protein